MSESSRVELALLEREHHAPVWKLIDGEVQRIGGSQEDEVAALARMDDVRENPRLHHPDLGIIPVYDAVRSRRSRAKRLRDGEPERRPFGEGWSF